MLELPEGFLLKRISQQYKQKAFYYETLVARGSPLGDFWVQFISVNNDNVISGRGVTVEQAWQSAVVSARCHSASRTQGA